MRCDWCLSDPNNAEISVTQARQYFRDGVNSKDYKAVDMLASSHNRVSLRKSNQLYKSQSLAGNNFQTLEKISQPTLPAPELRNTWQYSLNRTSNQYAFSRKNVREQVDLLQARPAHSFHYAERGGKVGGSTNSNQVNFVFGPSKMAQNAPPKPAPNSAAQNKYLRSTRQAVGHQPQMHHNVKFNIVSPAEKQQKYSQNNGLRTLNSTLSRNHSFGLEQRQPIPGQNFPRVEVSPSLAKPKHLNQIKSDIIPHQQPHDDYQRRHSLGRNLQLPLNQPHLQQIICKKTESIPDLGDSSAEFSEVIIGYRMSPHDSSKDTAKINPQLAFQKWSARTSKQNSFIQKNSLDEVIE